MMSAADSFPYRLVILAAMALSASACVSGRHSMGVAVGEEHTKVVGGGVAGAPAAASGDGDAFFQLLCWNIHKADDPAFPEELGGILAKVPVNDQVILCLQETRSNTLAILPPESVAGLSGHYAESWRYPLSKRSTGVMTVGPSALRPLWGQRLRSQSREFFVTSPKVCLRSEMETKDGKSLLVLNCHGLNFVTSSMLAKQLDLVFDPLIAGGRDADRAVVVCGDFNVWSDDRLAVLESRVEAAGLMEVGVPDHRGPDTTVWLNVVAPLVNYDSAIPLDRIYVRGVDVLECRMVEGTRSSDHAPLAMRFRLEE